MKKVKIIAIVSAVLFMLFTWIYISGLENKKNNENLVEIIVPNKNIVANTIVNGESLKKIKVAKNSVNKNAIKDTKDIVGKMAKDTLYENEPIIKERVINKEEKAPNYGLAYVISEGKRGMSIAVGLPEGVSNFLKVGNYIDVFHIGKFDYHVVGKNVSENDSKLTKQYSTILLQDVKIIGLETAIEKTSDKKDAKPTAYKTVTLELKPEEFLKLTLAIKSGDVWLGLRPEGDHKKVDATDMLLDNIIDKAKLIKSIKQEFER